MKSAALMILATTLVAAPASAQQVKWRLLGVSYEAPVLAPAFPQPSDYRYFKKPAPPYVSADAAFGVTPLSTFLSRKSSPAPIEAAEKPVMLAHWQSPPVDRPPPGF